MISKRRPKKPRVLKRIWWIPAEIKSLNELLRMHRWARAQETLRWKKHVMCIFGFKDPKEHQRVRLALTSYRYRKLDHDNLVGGAKPVIDAIKYCGWIKDDSPEWVDITYHQEQIKHNELRPVTRIGLSVIKTAFTGAAEKEKSRQERKRPDARRSGRKKTVRRNPRSRAPSSRHVQPGAV